MNFILDVFDSDLSFLVSLTYFIFPCLINSDDLIVSSILVVHNGLI